MFIYLSFRAQRYRSDYITEKSLSYDVTSQVLFWREKNVQFAYFVENDPQSHLSTPGMLDKLNILSLVP